MTSSNPDMQAAAKFFFSQQAFAVAGASTNPAKFGHKIFAWYLNRDLPATPLNPGAPHIEVNGRKYDTVDSPSKVPNPTSTGLSFVTPPPITAELLKEAKEVGIKTVWLQPGTFTDKELEYAIREFPGGAIGGFSEGTVGGEGWCVLVDGDAAIRAAKKDGKSSAQI